MVGDVRDVSQAAVPGATVTIRDIETNQTRSTTTSDTGAFSFLALPPAAYEVKVEKGGFRSAVRSGVNIAVNSVSRADFQLELGQL